MRIFLNVSIHVGTTALFLMSVFCREECATGIHFACVLVEHPQNACREPARVQSGQTVIPAGATGRICAARRCSAAVCRGQFEKGSREELEEFRKDQISVPKIRLPCSWHISF